MKFWGDLSSLGLSLWGAIPLKYLQNFPNWKEAQEKEKSVSVTMYQGEKIKWENAQGEG